ncbi:hypothetical protein N7527_001798, partial [Penicillium freii]
MKNPSKSPEVADGHGEAASCTQISGIEDVSMPSHERTPLTYYSQSDTEKDKLAVEPLQPVLEILKQLEREDPKLGTLSAFDKQVARLHAIDDALDEVRRKLIGVLKVWNGRSVGELAILPEE